MRGSAPGSHLRIFSSIWQAPEQPIAWNVGVLAENVKPENRAIFVLSRAREGPPSNIHVSRVRFSLGSAHCSMNQMRVSSYAARTATEAMPKSYGMVRP